MVTNRNRRSNTACYSLTYFWRNSIFMLPKDVLARKVCTVFDTDIDLQAGYSLAMTVGFGVKLPAISIMSSTFLLQSSL